jgi:hypothetical protein
MRLPPLRAVAAATTLVVFTAACTTDPSDTSAADPAAAAPAGEVALSAEAVVAPTPETVRGWVSLGDPVVGATVTVTDGAGTPVGPAVTSDDVGYFETTVPYGPDHLVTATGGTAGGRDITVTLRAQMNTDDPEAAANLGHLDVNMASTLVVEHLERNPDLDEEQAEAAVAQAVGVHPDTDISGMVGADPSLFDPQAFNGGDPLSDEHVDGVADAIAAAPSGEPVAAAAFPLTNPVAGLATDIVQGFLASQGENLLTKALGLGGDDGTLAELRAMRTQLDQLQTALAEVSAQARQLAADGVYAAAVDATNDVRGGVRTATRLYMEPVGDRAIALADARHARAAHGADAAAEQVAAADRAVTDAEGLYQTALTNFRNNYNTLAGGAFVKLNLYLEAGTGDAKSIVAKYGDTLRGQRFISQAHSDALFAVYDDFASWQATAAYLEAEYQSAIGGNVAGAIALFEEAVARQEQQLPARITVPGVVLDVSTGLMWQGAGTGPHHWEIAPNDYAGRTRPAPPGTPPGPAPYGGWRLPNVDELKSLVRDRGNRNVRDYMVSISTPTGFNRGWWTSLNASIWTSTLGQDPVTYMGQVFDSRTWQIVPIPNHAVLQTSGNIDRLPTMAGSSPKLASDQTRWVNARMADANAYVVQVRSVGNERYL